MVNRKNVSRLGFKELHDFTRSTTKNRYGKTSDIFQKFPHAFVIEGSRKPQVILEEFQKYF
jgi:hypothetical protein